MYRTSLAEGSGTEGHHLPQLELQSFNLTGPKITYLPVFNIHTLTLIDHLLDLILKLGGQELASNLPPLRLIDVLLHDLHPLVLLPELLAHEDELPSVHLLLLLDVGADVGLALRENLLDDGEDLGVQVGELVVQDFGHLPVEHIDLVVYVGDLCVQLDRQGF